MPFAEGEAVILLKQENGRLHGELRKEVAERKALKNWIEWFLVDEMEIDYETAVFHVIGCKKCWIDWDARGIHLCDDYKPEE